MIKKNPKKNPVGDKGHLNSLAPTIADQEGWIERFNDVFN
jgi:hypothetical protein